MSLGGRAAEEVIFNTVTTGAENDIEKATNMARSMITMFGMSDRFGLMQLEGVEDQYLTGRKVLNCSDETAARVDEEVMKILAESYEEAKRLLSENRELMEELANFLLEKESITGKEFMKIFHKYIPEEEEEKDVTAEAEKTGENAEISAETDKEGSKEGGELPLKEDKEVSEEKDEPSGQAPNFTLVDTPSGNDGQ